MKVDFTGRNVAVTGGANGIGRACVETFLAAGAKVSIIDRDGEEPCDVTDAAAVQQALERAGALDVVVVNAGIGVQEPLLSTSGELWSNTLAVNLTGAFHTVQAAARIMIKQRSGAIVVTASTNSFDGENNLVAYNASKAGLLGLIHTAANELGPYNVRINAVCPGMIRTRLTSGLFAEEKAMKEYFRHLPLGRGGEPQGGQCDCLPRLGRGVVYHRTTLTWMEANGYEIRALE
ncbi:MAG: SDR family oxidoreductase [Bryobacteraceae bacterium]